MLTTMDSDPNSRKTKIRIAIFALIAVVLGVGFLIVMFQAQQKKGHLIESRECTGICTDAPASTEQMMRKKAPPAPAPLVPSVPSEQQK